MPRGHQQKQDPDLVPKALYVSLDPELRAQLQAYHDATGRGQRTTSATARELIARSLAVDPPSALLRQAAMEVAASAKRFALPRIHEFLADLQEELARNALEFAQGRQPQFDEAPLEASDEDQA